MLTARERYDLMIRSDLAPWFRAHGFRKTRNVFTRADGDARQRIDFQASAWGSRHDVKFTINVEVGLASIDDGAFLSHVRIGALLPGGRDHWWNLDSSTDCDALATSILHILEELVWPWVQARSGLEELMAIARSDPASYPYEDLSRFAMKLREAGLHEQSQEIRAIEAARPRGGR